MLGKLFKYEMKSTGRIFLPFFIAIFGLALINKLTITAFSGFNSFQIPQAILIAIYVIILIATYVLTIIVTIQRFYKNLLGQEGYLMFTLPVSTSSNILAKAFAAIIWDFCTLLVTLASIAIIIPNYGWVKQFDWATFTAKFEQAIGMNFNLFIVFIIISSILSTIAFTLMVYTSISIGQLANNHKLLASFVAFVGIYVVEEIINFIFVIIVGFNSGMKMFAQKVPPAGWVFTIFIISFIIEAILITAYFFVTRYILKNHLNLE